jgi:hypothetical protein
LSVGVAILSEADLRHLAQELALVHAISVRPFVCFVLGHPEDKFNHTNSVNIQMQTLKINGNLDYKNPGMVKKKIEESTEMFFSNLIKTYLNCTLACRKFQKF